MIKGQRGISAENKIQGRVSNNEVFDVWSGFFIVIKHILLHKQTKGLDTKYYNTR